MAASAKKKIVTKDDLRRLMKEKQNKRSTSSHFKKIDHPLAKYNSLNKLVCILCNKEIKNDLLWEPHLQSKLHKENTISLKTQGPAKPLYLEPTSDKRKAEFKIPDGIKKQKIDASQSSKQSVSKGLPEDFFDDEKKKREITREKAKAALLAGYSSSEESESDDESSSQKQSLKSSSSEGSKSSKGLPSDFFDPGFERAETDEENTDEKTGPTHNKTMSEILPEGFFDDPKMDAKVRKVEYKDKMEEEWNLFQKEMKEEHQVSEVLIEEEDEQVNHDRKIEEIDDQIQRWQEVENLHVKKETIKKTCKEGSKDEDSDEELDEDDLDQFLEWRAKKVMK